MSFRFVHTADIHLDSPLRSLALRHPELAEVIGNATRKAFVKIIDLCLEERVNALLLAGDLYDGEQTSMKTARFLAGELRRLHEAGIQTFVIRGNHDALSKITRELVLPDSVTVFGPRADLVAINCGNHCHPIVIHGLSFTKPHAPESLLPQFKPPVEGAVNIGMMHTSLGGSPGHDRYAPCSLADLEQTGFRYWALGHIHKRSTAEGQCTVVMPGSPQGRDINEAGQKSVSLVTVADDGSLSIDERSVSVAQFERISINATGVNDWRDLAKAISQTLECARNSVQVDHLVARLYFTGSTPLTWRIRRDIDLLKEEADLRASRIERCWVEKVEVRCRVPESIGQPSEDPVLGLRRLIESEIGQTDGFRQEAEGIAMELRGHLPSECRDFFGSDEDSFRAALNDLVMEGTDDVLAYLHAQSEGTDA